MRDHDPIEIDGESEQERRERRSFYFFAAVILTALLFVGLRLFAS